MNSTCKGVSLDITDYLRTKKEKLAHLLSFNRESSLDELELNEFQFASIEVAIQELRAGRMIVVVDDEDRENEGDLTMAAEMITTLWQLMEKG